MAMPDPPDDPTNDAAPPQRGGLFSTDITSIAFGLLALSLMAFPTLAFRAAPHFFRGQMGTFGLVIFSFAGALLSAVIGLVVGLYKGPRRSFANGFGVFLNGAMVLFFALHILANVLR